MKSSRFFTIKAVISLAFGAALILLPDPVMSLFDINLAESGKFITKLFGVDMLAIGFVCWYCRKSAANLVNEIALGVFIADAVGLVIMVAGQINGIMNSLGWFNVALWSFLTLGMGYTRFIQPNINR